MLNLRSIYYYFLALKISSLKFCKKIYFKTNFYKKSLVSITPKQFYFYPNTFLLSSITNNENFSFNLSDIDPYTLWIKQNSKKEEESLHNFLWLNLINRKNDAVIIQKIIIQWINKNNTYKKTTWSSSIASKRIISWILNANIILNNDDKNFKEIFFQSIIIQINHLKKNFKFENSDSKKLEILTAILLSGLVFKEYFENFNFSLKELKKIIENFFDNEGFPKNRNPNDLIKFSKYLILIKECSKDAQQYIPDYLEEIIDKNLSCLTTILNPLNQMPLFNGATEIKMDKYLNYIERLNYSCKKNKNLVGKIQILKNQKSIVFFDVGEPPKKSFSEAYQLGPLSFEYFFNNQKIITNCGYGKQISKKAKLVSRLTSAQSTLCLNDTSVTKLERNKIINRTFGAFIKNSFNVFDINFSKDDLHLIASASHNAYEKKFGYIHKRSLSISKKSSELKGTDFLIKKGNPSPKVNYHIRFHLYPGISATETISGNSILIQIDKNKSLIFSSPNQKISLEKSIFLGRNQILNNFCITINGNLSDKSQTIDWEIKKNN